MSLSTLRSMLLDLSAIADRRNMRQRRNLLRASRWDAFQMTETEFIKTFRLSKELVANLINEISPYIRRERRKDALTVKDKVLIALGFFATGSYQTIVGQSMYNAVSQPSVSRAVRQVALALNNPNIFRKYVVFPTAREVRDKIKQRFYIKYKLPGVVGCIDGTHVALVKPIDHEERFMNRKGYHLLNVMLICDMDLNILCVDPSHPGSTHDSKVWNEHPLNEYINNIYDSGEIVYFLGDSGYPLRKTMMTPFLNASEGSAEENYYKVQVSARNVVERCIGVLKCRFRCLLVARKLHYSPVVAGQIVNACTVLHNMANRARIPQPQLSAEEELMERDQQINYRIAEESLRGASQVEPIDEHKAAASTRDYSVAGWLSKLSLTGCGRKATLIRLYAEALQSSPLLLLEGLGRFLDVCQLITIASDRMAKNIFRHSKKAYKGVKQAIERNKGFKVFAKDLSLGQSQLMNLKTDDGGIVTSKPELIMAETQEDLSTMLNDPSRASAEVELKMNKDKAVMIMIQ